MLLLLEALVDLTRTTFSFSFVALPTFMADSVNLKEATEFDLQWEA